MCWCSNHQGKNRECGLQRGSWALWHSASFTCRPRVRDWKCKVRIWKSLVTWLLGGLGTQQVLVGCMDPKPTFPCLLSGHPHHLSQCQVCSYARSDFEVPVRKVGIQKFCTSDRFLNTISKIKTKAAASNACCAETQAGKNAQHWRNIPISACADSPVEPLCQTVQSQSLEHKSWGGRKVEVGWGNNCRKRLGGRTKRRY